MANKKPYRPGQKKEKPKLTRQYCARCSKELLDYEILQGIYCFKCTREKKKFDYES